jgi:hypothetical protein
VTTAATASPTTHEPEPDDLDGIEAETRALLVAVQERERELAPEALTDPAASTELDRARLERQVVEGKLKTVGDARLARRHRQVAALEREADEARDAARRRVESLDTRLLKQAKTVDTAAKTLAEAASAFCKTFSDRQDARVAGGLAEYGTGGDPTPAILGAVAHAMRVAGVPRVISRRGLEAAWKPLASTATDTTTQEA